MRRKYNMCCLFGLIDYGRMFSANEKNRILKVLATECEARGTDAIIIQKIKLQEIFKEKCI